VKSREDTMRQMVVYKALASCCNSKNGTNC